MLKDRSKEQFEESYDKGFKSSEEPNFAFAYLQERLERLKAEKTNAFDLISSDSILSDEMSLVCRQTEELEAETRKLLEKSIQNWTNFSNPIFSFFASLIASSGPFVLVLFPYLFLIKLEEELVYHSDLKDTREILEVIENLEVKKVEKRKKINSPLQEVFSSIVKKTTILRPNFLIIFFLFSSFAKPLFFQAASLAEQLLTIRSKGVVLHELSAYTVDLTVKLWANSMLFNFINFKKPFFFLDLMKQITQLGKILQIWKCLNGREKKDVVLMLETNGIKVSEIPFKRLTLFYLISIFVKSCLVLTPTWSMSGLLTVDFLIQKSLFNLSKIRIFGKTSPIGFYALCGGLNIPNPFDLLFDQIDTSFYNTLSLFLSEKDLLKVRKVVFGFSRKITLGAVQLGQYTFVIVPTIMVKRGHLGLKFAKIFSNLYLKEKHGKILDKDYALNDLLNHQFFQLFMKKNFQSFFLIQSHDQTNGLYLDYTRPFCTAESINPIVNLLKNKLTAEKFLEMISDGEIDSTKRTWFLDKIAKQGIKSSDFIISTFYNLFYSYKFREPNDTFKVLASTVKEIEKDRDELKNVIVINLFTKMVENLLKMAKRVEIE